MDPAAVRCCSEPMFTRMLPLAMACAAASFSGSLNAAAPTQLSPFVLPWDNVASGPVDLTAWNAAPAGAKGFLSIDENGHYSVGGERIRLIGVNITSGSCFPIPEYADAVAAHLAKFGVNTVRFHHMDAAWNAEPIIDYASGNTRSLNPQSFARLHHFVAALQKQGIYANINLLVSRLFTAADGLPIEVNALEWKDTHVLGFFDDRALELQKEYAKNLLTTPGPNGEPPLAQNPAVGFVEILNENGLLQKWYEGVLDRLGAPFRAELAVRWQEWLKAHYASTEQLRAKWGGASEAPGAVLASTRPAPGQVEWKIEQSPGTKATIAPSTLAGQHASLAITIRQMDTKEWEQLRLRARDVPVVPGRLYTVSFSAQAERPVNVYCHVGDRKSAFFERLFHARIDSRWTRFQGSFVAPDGLSTITFTLGGMNGTGTFHLSDLVVRQGGVIEGLPSGTSLEQGNVPVVLGLSSGEPNVTAQVQADWLRFLTDLEHRYWETMSQYIKQTLGFKGIVFGTIISNSPPTVQGRLESVDGHCYWTHPRFLQGEWSSKGWIVTPQSMVTAPSGSTIGQLAMQRVKGKPFTVTEYQHSSPNPFAAEAPIFAAAYGALQDWDGIWFFDYRVPVDPKELPEYAGRISSYFDDSQHPARLANYLIAAALFRRGDVSAARDAITVPLGSAAENELLRTHGAPWTMPDAATVGLNRLWSLQKRVQLDTAATARAGALPQYTAANNIHSADTGELAWNAATGRETFTVVTPLTRAAVGFIAQSKLALGNVSVELGATSDNWATLGLTLLEGSWTSEKAARGVIVATARVENTNQTWTDASRSSLADKWGDAPTRIETVQGKLTLPLAAARVKVFALDERGQRARPAKITEQNGQAVVELGSAGPTLWYELEVSAK
jgi:hypothetical protein